jgi:hypothetical protein
LKLTHSSIELTKQISQKFAQNRAQCQNGHAARPFSDHFVRLCSNFEVKLLDQLDKATSQLYFELLEVDLVVYSVRNLRFTKVKKSHAMWG